MPLPDVAVAMRAGSLADEPAPLLAVPYWPGLELGPGADEVGASLGLDLRAHLTKAEAKGEPGEVHSIPALGRLGAVETVLLVGLGARDAVTPAVLRKAGAAVVRRGAKPAAIATTIPAGADTAGLQAFVEGVLLATYSFALKASAKAHPLRALTIVDGKAATRGKAREAVERGLAWAQATALARDLANAPSLDKTPAWLATEAQRRGAKAGVAVRVWKVGQLEAEGFGGILAVGSGSTRPPRLLQLDYAPKGARRHVVLVGKGITFDSGGLSLKPNEGMAAMKTDMSGGAAVIATLCALPGLGLPVRVTGLVPTAENMPSGTAVRPGDVIRHYGGRTVEVLNTDAEGRLVLADALAYADAQLDPDYVVDIATLTGAIGIALGKRTAGLFSPDDALAAALVGAGAAAGERFWRMPLVEDYRRDLDSETADLKNVGGKFGGGAITAALFLREFAGGRRWAHLDIAGAARADADDDELSKGGTGFGVRTLLTWLSSLR